MRERLQQIIDIEDLDLPTLQGLNHTCSRERKIYSGKTKGRDFPPSRKSYRTRFYLVLPERAKRFQPKGRDPFSQEKRGKLWHQAFREIRRNNKYNHRRAGKYAPIALRRKQEDWSEVGGTIQWRTLPVRIEQFNRRLFYLGKSESADLTDPFIVWLFENEGKLLKELACYLTGYPSDQMKVFFTERSISLKRGISGNKPIVDYSMRELVNMDTFKNNALRYVDLNRIYFNYANWPFTFRWDIKDLSLCFAQVWSEEELLLSLDFTPAEVNVNEQFRQFEDRLALPGGILGIGWLGDQKITNRDKIPFFKEFLHKPEEPDFDEEEIPPGKSKTQFHFRHFPQNSPVVLFRKNKMPPPIQKTELVMKLIR
jgi:hypothetical protein